MRARFGSGSRRSGWNVSLHLIRSRTEPSVRIKSCGDVVIARVIFYEVIHAIGRDNGNGVDLLAASATECVISFVVGHVFLGTPIQAVTDNVVSATGVPGKSDRVLTI